MLRLRTVALSFAVMLTVFAVTHLLRFPGSIRHLMDATGGRKILDMQPSSSADETYARLEAFGELGRELYLRAILTVDLVFPLSVFSRTPRCCSCSSTIRNVSSCSPRPWATSPEASGCR